MFSINKAFGHLNSISGMAARDAIRFTRQVFDMLPKVGYEKEDPIRRALSYQAGLSFGPRGMKARLGHEKVKLFASPADKRWYELSSTKHTAVYEEMVSILTGATPDGKTWRGYSTGRNAFLHEVETGCTFSSQRFSFNQDEMICGGWLDIAVTLSDSVTVPRTGNVFCNFGCGPVLRGVNELFEIIALDINYGRSFYQPDMRRPDKKQLPLLLDKFFASTHRPAPVVSKEAFQLPLGEDDVALLAGLTGMTGPEVAFYVKNWERQVNNTQGDSISSCTPLQQGYRTFTITPPSTTWLCDGGEDHPTDRPNSLIREFVAGRAAGDLDLDLFAEHARILVRLAHLCRQDEAEWKQIADMAPSMIFSPS